MNYRFYFSLGIVIICIGVLLNEFIIKSVLHFGSPFDSAIKSTFLIILELMFIAIGLYIIIRGKLAIQNLFTLFCSIIVLLAFAEIILSIKWIDDLSSDSPIWIPAKYKEISKEFNNCHLENSRKNEFGFNDINHSYNKSEDTNIRIAILGDSFIWGAGVLDSVIWTRKLQSKFETQGVTCEILNWGKSGWSTEDEFDFLKATGVKYQFDLLIFAFVVNDPIMDSSSLRLFISKDDFSQKAILNPLSVLFPNSVSFFTDIMNNFFSTYFDFGYAKWLEKRAYSVNNLQRYSLLIKDIKKFCNDNNIELCFIMTPENHNPLLQHYFNMVTPILDKNNVSYLNLFPMVQNHLGQLTNRQLWANPADGHPGGLVTDIYAEYGFQYIVENKLSNQSLKLIK